MSCSPHEPSEDLRSLPRYGATDEGAVQGRLIDLIKEKVILRSRKKLTPPKGFEPISAREPSAQENFLDAASGN